MKSHPTRYSPKYFADFAEAFKPVAKLGSKLTKLVEQTRQVISDRGRFQQPISKPTKSEVDCNLYLDITTESKSQDVDSSSTSSTSSDHSLSAATKRKKLMTSDPNDETGGLGYCEKGVVKQMPQNRKDPAFQKQYERDENFRLHHDNNFTVQPYHRDKPIDQLRCLTEKAIFVYRDCHRPVYGGECQDVRDRGVFNYGSLKPCEDKYACSGSYDEYRWYFKPTYNTRQFVLITATEGRLLKEAALTSPDPTERACAMSEYDNLVEWLDGIPTTDNPDHISLSGEQTEESVVFTTDPPPTQRPWIGGRAEGVDFHVFYDQSSGPSWDTSSSSLA